MVMVSILLNVNLIRREMLVLLNLFYSETIIYVGENNQRIGFSGANKHSFY